MPLILSKHTSMLHFKYTGTLFARTLLRVFCEVSAPPPTEITQSPSLFSTSEVTPSSTLLKNASPLRAKMSGIAPYRCSIIASVSTNGTPSRAESTLPTVVLPAPINPASTIFARTFASLKATLQSLPLHPLRCRPQTARSKRWRAQAKRALQKRPYPQARRRCLSAHKRSFSR